jgi:hypothetical protein
VVCTSGLVMVKQSMNSVADIPSSKLLHPGMLPELPDVGSTVSGAWLPPRHATADDDARSGPGRCGDGRLVLWLQGRVGHPSSQTH